MAVTRHRRHGTAQRSDRIQHSIYQDQQHWYTSHPPAAPSHVFTHLSGGDDSKFNSNLYLRLRCRSYCSSPSHSPRPVASCMAVHSRLAVHLNQINWQGFNPMINFLFFFWLIDSVPLVRQILGETSQFSV